MTQLESYLIQTLHAYYEVFIHSLKDSRIFMKHFFRTVFFKVWFIGPQGLKILLGSPQGQIYFYNIKVLFECSIVLTFGMMLQKQWWLKLLPNHSSRQCYTSAHNSSPTHTPSRKTKQMPFSLNVLQAIKIITSLSLSPRTHIFLIFHMTE